MENRIYNLEIENQLLKQQLRRKEREVQLANDLINNYYKQNKHNVNEYLEYRKEQRLSDGARQMVHDIESGVI